MIWASHPFAKSGLNPRDEIGNYGCAVCGRPESVHRTTELPKEVRDRLIATLPSDPRDLLTEQDRAEFAEWAELNRLRKTRIAMETGVSFSEVG
jgi:hypothetical protein